MDPNESAYDRALLKELARISAELKALVELAERRMKQDEETAQKKGL
jgi:hypothetical protein